MNLDKTHFTKGQDSNYYGDIQGTHYNSYYDARMNYNQKGNF